MSLIQRLHLILLRQMLAGITDAHLYQKTVSMC